MSAVFDFKDIGQRVACIETKQPEANWPEPLSEWTVWPGIDHVGHYPKPLWSEIVSPTLVNESLRRVMATCDSD